MTQTLQKRFIFTAMTAITLLIVVVLGAVNIFNGVSFVLQTREMLEILGENDGLPPGLAPDPLPIPDGSQRDREGWFFSPLADDDLLAARFFIVTVGEDAAVSHIDISRISSVDPIQAARYASDVIRGGEEKGMLDGFQYATFFHGAGRTMIFLSVESQLRSILSVLLISVGVGLLGWGVMLPIVVQLSKSAIRPIAESIEKQKQFVTDAGHELKTPLAIILANTDALELHTGETKWSRNIRAQTVRLNGLMQNLLTLSRADEGLLVLEMEEVAISELLEEALYPFYEAAALKSVVIETDILADLYVEASKDHLSRLFSILLDNAVKYVSPEGKIGVVLNVEETGVVLTVSNTCLQKPAEDIDRLFDRFYRGDAARTQKSGGYGIGLSAARAIVTSHKGSITAGYADSKMTFKVKLQC